VLLTGAAGRVAGSLSVSAPIERGQPHWNDALRAAGEEISTRLRAAPKKKRRR